MSKETSTSLLLVHNEQLARVKVIESGEMSVRDCLGLDDLFQGYIQSDRLQQLGLSRQSALIVPDFWIGTKTYALATQKRSIVEPFIQRKLQSDHPELHEVQDFYYQAPGKTPDGKRGVRVTYLPDPNFHLLYQNLSRYGFAPRLITTPGLLWEAKLAKILPDFDQGGICLASLVDTECFFYFFHKGQYLFSRDIAVSRDFDLSDKLGTLSYEINQSRFLFSQKVSAEIDRTYLVTSGKEGIDAINLSEQLGREVVELPVEAPSTSGDHQELLNPLLYFTAGDLQPSEKAGSLTHRFIKRDQEWKGVQWTAIFIAAVLALALGLQSGFLLWYGGQSASLLSASAGQQRQKLSGYNQLLDQMAKEVGRPAPTEVLAKALRSIPPQVEITEIHFEDGLKPTIRVNAEVTPPDIEAFDRLLRTLAGSIREQFALPAFSPDSIRYSTETPADSQSLHYKLEFQVEAP